MTKQLSVQVFGTQADAGVRKALRFFKERRVLVHFVDFKRKNPSKAELRRFFDKFGAEAMVNRDAKRFQALGFGSVHYSYSRWLEVACDEPTILRLPLVRNGSKLTLGVDEATWKEWAKEADR